jgi:hypothetical protein
LNLLLLQEVDEEQETVKYTLASSKNEAHEMLIARKTEGFLSFLIGKHLRKDETKFREFSTLIS